MTTRVPMMPTSKAGAAIINKMLRGSRSGRASGGFTMTRTGVTVGAELRGPRTKPLLDTPSLRQSMAMEPPVRLGRPG